MPIVRGLRKGKGKAKVFDDGVFSGGRELGSRRLCHEAFLPGKMLSLVSFL